jgi:hypothetical protein
LRGGGEGRRGALRALERLERLERFAAGGPGALPPPADRDDFGERRDVEADLAEFEELFPDGCPLADALARLAFPALGCDGDSLESYMHQG